MFYCQRSEGRKGMGNLSQQLHWTDAEVHALREALLQTRAALAGKEVEVGTLRQDIDRQKLAFREVSHRLLNSLQLLTSALYLQEKGVGVAEAAGAIKTARLRIEAIARVHRHLSSDGSTSVVDFGSYIEDLAGIIAKSLDVSCAVRTTPISLDADMASNLGIAMNELLINAAKYAASSNGHAPIEISLDCDGDKMLRLAVRDHGPGIAKDYLNRKTSSLGLKLVQEIAHRFHGDLHARNDAGAHFTIKVPLNGGLDGPNHPAG
jgi:two-component sensor histidine kinase